MFESKDDVGKRIDTLIEPVFGPLCNILAFVQMCAKLFQLFFLLLDFTVGMQYFSKKNC